MKYGLFKKQYRRKTDHYKLLRRIIVSCFARPYGIAPTQKYKKVKYHHESLKINVVLQSDLIYNQE